MSLGQIDPVPTAKRVFSQKNVKFKSFWRFDLFTCMPCTCCPPPDLENDENFKHSSERLWPRQLSSLFRLSLGGVWFLSEGHVKRSVNVFGVYRFLSLWAYVNQQLLPEDFVTPMLQHAVALDFIQAPSPSKILHIERKRERETMSIARWEMTLEEPIVHL